MKGFIKDIDWYNIDAMKYWSFTSATSIEQRKQIVNNAIFSGDYLGALKVDGYYQRILKDEEGNCFMIARSRNVKGEVVNKVEWLPHIKSWLDLLPNGTCLLCECYLPGHEGSNNITSILGCLKDKAIARQESEQKLHLYVFDIMAYNGVNYNKLGYADRAEALTRVSEMTNHQSPYIEYAKFYSGEALWIKLQEYLNSGREGMVIMRKDAIVYNKRTPARVSIKIKKELKESIDVVILGANPPTRNYGGTDIMNWTYWENDITGEKLEGRYYQDMTNGRPISPVTKTHFNGWAGSLVIGVTDLTTRKIKPIGSISGLTEEMLKNWQSYKGKVIEITGMQFMYDKNNIFTGIRHPKFVRVREDKTPVDCTMEQFQ